MENKELQQRLYDKFGQEKVKELKKQFPTKNLIVIEIDDKLALLRPPTIEEVANVSVMMASADLADSMVTASRFLLSCLWLMGDQQLQDDDEYFASIMLQLQNIIEVKKTVVSRF